MDTLHTHIEANNSRATTTTTTTTMGTSETQHSDKAATSDEEDFKLNIPYFDADGEAGGNSSGIGINSGTNGNTNENDYARLQQQQQSSPTTSSNYDLMQQNTDDDDGNQLNYANWDNDDLMGSDYSGQSASESPNLFTSTAGGPSTPAAAAFFDDPPDIKPPDLRYSPHELLIQPPNRYHSTMQFEMQPPPQHQRRHLQALAPPPHLQHMQHRHHHPTLHHPQYGSSGSGGGAGAGMPFHHHPQHHGPQHSTHHQQTPQPPTSSGPMHHHPNMWYPNAPYGASRYGCDPHRYSYHYNAGYGHDPMMDMLQLSNSGREARNRAEKNRRDKLNGSIQELSTMVPHVAESPRRVDKTAVLRFAAHGLRLKYVFGENLQQQRTQTTDPLMKLLDSFFITLTCHGQIVLISSSIEQQLGHCQADLYGQNILHITHPEDHSMLKQQLIPTDLENLFDVHEDDEDGEPRMRTQAEEELIDKKLKEDKRSFTVRLARAGPRSEPTAYEVVRIDGCFRRSDAAPRGVKNSPFPSSLQLIRRSRGRDDSIPLHTISGNDIVLIAVARIIRPPKAVNRVIEANNLEYKTRHLIDGRIIDCDQRIGIVAGYMTDEIRNLSPFTFIHQDDVRWVIVALRQMYDCNSSYGESTYRLLSRNGNFIYLQSRGYLEIDKNSNKVHSFICINTLLAEDEGKRRVEEMKRKFSIIINTDIPQSMIDAPASDNPQQLEKAVLRLIQNLQKTSDDEENHEHNGAHDSSRKHSDHKSTTYYGSRQLSSSHSQAASCASSSKTPPLALVPPETDSVKSSISKSVSVVNVTAARSLHRNQRLKSPLSTTEDDDEDDDFGGGGGQYKYHAGTSPPNLLPRCTCRSFNGGSEICDYCRRYNYMQQSPTARAAQKHKLSVSQSSDDEVPQKRRLTETDKTPAIQTPPAQSPVEVIPTLEEIIEQSTQLTYSGDESSENLDEQQIPADIFVNFKDDFEIESSQNNDKCTTKSKTIKETRLTDT